MKHKPEGVILSQAELDSFIEATNAQPHTFLGMHPCKHEGKRGVVVRAFLRDARSCQVIDLSGGEETRYPLERIAGEGFFEGFIEDRAEVFRYRLRITRKNGEIRQFFDPYRFLPQISDHDLYLFNEGNDHFAYRKLGARALVVDDVPGVAFAVWAPSARRVSVVGDFNRWDGRYHPMRVLGGSGVWEIFIPGLEPGEKYKFEVAGGDGFLHLKTDPYASFYESPPHNAAIVQHQSEYDWNDQEWMEGRQERDWRREPVSIYEVHAGSWKRIAEDGQRPLSYRELATELVDYVQEQGYTHVEFLPLAEHPFAGSWGYQVTGFFAPTHRYGTPEDFMFLVDACHRAGIGVIMDWVPAHFPKDAFALARYDGTALYEHEDPRQGYHHDWDTYIFNYGRHEVRNFLISSALAWFDRFHIDGLRVDAVASMLYLDYSRKDGEWIPNRFGGRENLEAIDFLRRTNELVHRYYPGALMIAEESTAWGGVTRPTSEGGLGFDLKWNMGWMHDTLLYFEKDPIHRKWHQNLLTFGMVYQFSECFTQVFSHDEVVHGKGSMINKMAAGDMSAKSRTLCALYGLMWAWPGKKTLFMGCEFGQSREWRYDGSLDWHLLQYDDHGGIQRLVRDLNALYTGAPAFHQGDADPAGFEWVSMNDADNSILAFLRRDPSGEGPLFLVVGHFTPVGRDCYRLGVPRAGHWAEVMNTNAAVYGGNDEGNVQGATAKPVQENGRPFSIEVDLPGNTVLVFRNDGTEA